MYVNLIFLIYLFTHFVTITLYILLSLSFLDSSYIKFLKFINFNKKFTPFIVIFTSSEKYGIIINFSEIYSKFDENNCV